MFYDVKEREATNDPVASLSQHRWSAPRQPDDGRSAAMPKGGGDKARRQIKAADQVRSPRAAWTQLGQEDGAIWNLGGEGADPVHIHIDDLRGQEIAELLATHIAFCRASSPPESTHVLDLDTLRSPEITFWSAWEGASLLGCAALKELDPAHGEVKSMHTAVRQRGRGVGLALLRQVVAEARSRGYRRLSLETGSMAAFASARALYKRFGFVGCQPFAGYRLDPNSVFMTLDLAGAGLFPARDRT